MFCAKRIKVKNKFSLIELMTVILIILLLMSLLMPTFSQLKMNARNSLCKGQLRQIGVLINSYAGEHNGYLPNDLKTDIPKSAVNVSGKSMSINNEFYSNWNGHLLPYVDSGLKNYNRTSKLRKDGEVYTYDTVYGTFPNKGTTKPADELDGGWAVIRDACYKGGFHELKLFICPEIHANTYDIGISNTFNGLTIPRVSEMTHYLGFVNMAWDYIGGGVPTTYLANDIFFGFDGPYMTPQQSLRVDQIQSISKKALLIEGGIAWAKGTNGEPAYLYYRLNRGDLTANGTNKYDTGTHKLNFVHDDKTKIFWIMKLSYYDAFPFVNQNSASKAELANKFNNAFAGKAAMLISSTASYYGDQYTIISYIDPADKPFDNFFNANTANPLFPFETFDEPEFHYLTGSMNVLFGDNSVITKDQVWLAQNRALIGQQTQD